jgi:hypothetical protein
MRRSSHRYPAIGLFLALSLGLGAAGSRAAELMETFDAGKPPDKVLGGILRTGRDGVWEASLADGVYTLRNTSDAQAVKYFNINGFAGDSDGLADASVEVDVAIGDGGELSGAGIIYRFDPANRSYLLFTLLSTGEYAAFVRGSGGFKLLARGSVPDLHSGTNRLAVHTNGDRIEFLVNDARAVSMGVRGATGKGVGLAAIGKGTFTFDNFAVRDAG